MRNDQYQRYYKRLEVIYQLYHYCKDKEFNMLRTNSESYATRHIKINNVQGLSFWFKNMDIFPNGIKRYNLYSSLMSYEHIPDRSGNLSTPIDINFWNKHYEYAKGYDFFIDIDNKDNKDFDLALYTVESIKKLFDKCNAPYELIFSGSGFHFKTPYNLISNDLSFDPNEKKNIYNHYSKILKKLHKDYSVMIDTGVTGSRQISKIPYSLACYKNIVTQSFQFNSNQEYAAFKQNPTIWKMPMYWMGKIYKRGRYIFNKDGNFDKLLGVLNLNG